MGGCSKAELYQKFLASYQKDFVSGSLCPCAGGEQLRRGKELLDSMAAPRQRFPLLDFYRLALGFVEAKSGEGSGQQSLFALGKALELLELICINLYLWPWRKEIKSIKTFTGAFVYFIEPVFPPDVLQGILVKMGYTQKGISEYVISKQVSKEDIGQLGFECFLARAECVLMQEILEQAVHSNCQDIVQLRSCLSLNQADCIKHLMAMKARPRKLSEWSAPANEGATKLGLSCEEGLDESGLPNSPLPLSASHQGTLGLRVGALEDRESDTANDPLSTSMIFPPDSIDLYRDYSDIAIAGNLGYSGPPKLLDVVNPNGEGGQCDSLLLLKQSMVQKPRSEPHIKLSPDQPQSLSFFPNSTLIATPSDSKNLKMRDRADFSTGDPNASLKHGALDATSQLYPEDRPSEKNYQASDSTSSVKYGKFLNGNSTSRKKESDPPVEIELKHMDKEKLPYPTTETAQCHPSKQLQSSEVQCVGLSHADPTGGKRLRQTHTVDQLAACRPPSLPKCCVCSPVEILRAPTLMEHSELMGNMLQDGGGQIVREPPQSFYIPPGSLEAGPPSAVSCNISGSQICPHCSLGPSASQRHIMTNDCLEIQELLIGESPDPYICVSKLPEGSVSLIDGKSVRCSHCRQDEDL
ncbi:uncharacterized protein [Chiloscyllium punctatum]|uniref:uncharacterized protein n=1 Tax=Chiloscyllium punctatum TaxID=137246 RepID=UPI003B63FB8A